MGKSIFNKPGCNNGVSCCYSKSIFNINKGSCPQKGTQKCSNNKNKPNITNNLDNSSLPNIINYFNNTNTQGNQNLP